MGSANAGEISYWNSATSIGGDNRFLWDDANGRLGLGVAAPVSTIHVENTTSMGNNRAVQMIYSNISLKIQ